MRAVVVEGITARLIVKGEIEAQVICLTQKEAIKEAKKMQKRFGVTGEIKVTGGDLTPEELKAVMEGDMLIA